MFKHKKTYDEFVFRYGPTFPLRASTANLGSSTQ